MRTSPEAASPSSGTRLPRWLFAALCLATFLAYLPAIRGPFLFDDRSLVYFLESPPSWANLADRLARLVTNATLIAESAIAGVNPASFHITNIVIHLLNGFLVWRILGVLLERRGGPMPGDRMAALAGAGLYLLHPLQTEAVAYISSRSEVLCALFAYLAFRIFLGSKPDEPMGWGRAIAATVLIALSALSKEPGVAMAGVFVAFDVFSPARPSLRPLFRRWRLYAPILAAAAVVGLKLYLTLSREGSAGVTGKNRPVDYLLTQFEVLWSYFRLIVLPWGQNLDHSYPVTKAPGSLFTWAAALGLAGLGVLLWRLRGRYPLAFLGFAFLLILLAPTSSIVPIDDAMAERRLYLGFPGVAMIAADLLRRQRPDFQKAAAVAAVLALLGLLTARRAGLYTSAVAMWRDSVKVNPGNGRAWFHLGFAYYEQGQCGEAVQAYQNAEKAGWSDITLLVDEALALDCAGRTDEAVAKLESSRTPGSHPVIWTTLGRMYARTGELDKALASLNEALRLNPSDSGALTYRGNVHLLRRDPAAALADYEQALRLAPDDTAAMKGRQAALAALGRAR